VPQGPQSSSIRSAHRPFAAVRSPRDCQKTHPTHGGGACAIDAAVTG